MARKKIVFYSMAYRGDVYPYVPIASELARRGHDVVYVVPREYHRSFASEPFRCAHSGTDFAATALDEHGPYVDRWGNKLGGAFLLRLYFGVFTIPHLDELYRAIDAEVRDADLLFSHPAASIIGQMTAEIHDVPVLVGDLFPMLLPSEHAPLAGMPYLGRRGNRIAIRLITSRLTDRLTYAREFRRYRAGLGLATDGWNVIDGRLSPISNLGLVPPAYVERQPDWPDNYRLVGFTPWAGPDGGRLDHDVEHFLDRGPPPVIVTLGTSAATARPELFDAAIQVLDRAGQRGLFLTSNANLAARVERANKGTHLVRPFLPLATALTRASAIVHSGAHGTNSLALLAGVPSVVVPCIFDQVVHARLQQARGTGIWVRKHRALDAALAAILDPSRGYAERARQFATTIADDGVAAAADEAERLLTSR